MITTKPYKDVVLEFDEAKHIFYANGKKVISVTGATGKIDKSFPLMWWQENLTKDYLLKMLEKGKIITADIVLEATALHRTEKKKAATIGRAVHVWASQHIKGESPDIPKNKKVRNGVLAFLRLENDLKIKFLSSEEHVYSKKHKFAGILDATARIKKEFGVLDLKTSKAYKNDKVYIDVRCQVAGYQLAKEEMTGKKFDVRWIVRLDRETGIPQIYRLDDYNEDKKAFLGALVIKRRELGMKK